MRRLRPEHRPIDPSDRLTWLPGDAAQCDLWFPPKKIPPLEDGTTSLLPVMVITAAHSRFMVARMIPTRHTQDLLLGGMWELLQQLGRVPRRLIWDNEAGIGRGKRNAEGIGAFTGTLATTLVRLKPYDPESKGVVERRNGFLETSFMPGRSFASAADFNAQLTEWLETANARVVRTIKARPVDLLDADRAAMLPLPPVAPVIGWVNRVRLGRDYYVRVDSNDYSVDPNVIGRFVEVRADLSRVVVRHDGRRVAAHDRVWARGMTVTDPRPRHSCEGVAGTFPTAPPTRRRSRGGGIRPGPGRLRPRFRPAQRRPRQRRSCGPGDGTVAGLGAGAVAGLRDGEVA